ncbi:MAG: ATPase, T2SS/T4P/T4SS family [Candidatus Delongbacteria bacterium]|nr:ATPase, T2SS/T4P/T4SS family [Candidatus Delongbacteria bacterium]
MQQKKAPNNKIVKLVDDLLSSSVKEGATEIYIEPKEEQSFIRAKVKGVISMLKGKNVIERKLHHEVVSRIKTLTRTMDTELHDLPQKGKMIVNVKNKDHYFKVITIPTLHGETVTIRNMAGWAKSVDVEKIFTGDKKLYSKVKDILNKKEGMVLITGMPGSAKTNISWSVLNEVSGLETKVFSIEDPTEIMLQSVDQIQVNKKSGMDFKKAVDSVINSDYDVMYVSDIDDSELAKTLMQESMGGRMVISQLMVPDAVEGLFCFSDMGIREYITGNAVRMVINSVLEKYLCPHCKQKAKYSQAELKKIGLKESEIKSGKFFKPKGCSKCENTGYKGRMVILEVLEINNSVKKAFIGGASHKEVTAVAKKEGALHTRKESALRLLKEGLIDLETAKKYI